jgi:hypothetical protein
MAELLSFGAASSFVVKFEPKPDNGGELTLDRNKFTAIRMYFLCAKNASSSTKD